MDTEHPEKIGEYEISGVIGKGAMGKIYKAAMAGSGKVVAIKVLPSEFMEDETSRERFDREAEAVSLLNHPNVVRLVDRGEEDGQVYFVMEYVPGTTLESVLRQRRLSLPEAIRVFKGVCKGLHAAHRKKVVHRDLAPRNILVSEDLSTVKIADFGISRVEAISRDQGTLSTTEFSLGSLHYMAPEQARNMATADHRADIYSLGVLFYEMLTGRVPVGRFNLPSQINSEVPPEVDPIVLKCLEADPRDRFSNVAGLLQKIAGLENQLRLGLVHEVRGLGNQTSKIFLKSTRSRTLQIALGALAVAALIGAAVFLARGRGAELEPPRAAPAAAPGGEAGASEEIAVESDGEAEGLLAGGDLEVPPLEGDGEEGQDESTESDPGASSAQPEPTKTPSIEQPPKRQASRPVAASSSSIAEDLEVARAKLEAGLTDEAQRDIDKLLAERSRASDIADAYLLLGEIHEKRGDIDAARAAYVELRSRFEPSDAAAEAMLRSARLLERDGNRDLLRQARALLGEVAELYAGTPWAPRALVRKAEIETEAKWETVDPVLGSQVPAALPTYRTLVSDYPDHPSSESALWNLGDMYEELKKFNLAASAFSDLGSRFPATSYDAWWRAGQLYDRRLDQDDKAVEAYRKVPESSRRHSDARRRIARLTR